MENNKQKENNWTSHISLKLQQALGEKYVVVCLEKVPYFVNIKSRNSVSSEKKDKYELEDVMEYEVDLLIKEKVDNVFVPRLIIESKYKKITTHDVITYNNKAQAHKKLYSGLRYGLMIGDCAEKNISPRVINHGSEFDFMFAFSGWEPTNAEWNLFVEVVNRNLNVSKRLENIVNDRRKKDKKRYYCVEKKIEFYE